MWIDKITWKQMKLESTFPISQKNICLSLVESFPEMVIDQRKKKKKKSSSIMKIWYYLEHSGE